MKKKKIVIISLCSIIGLIFLDFIIAILFNNSPIIKIRDYYDGGVTVYKDKGIFTNTYKCSNGKTKTVLKTTKYVCPMNDIEKDIKEAITITFDTKGGSIIDVLLSAKILNLHFRKILQEMVINSKVGLIKMKLQFITKYYLQKTQLFMPFGKK